MKTPSFASNRSFRVPSLLLVAAVVLTAGMALAAPRKRAAAAPPPPAPTVAAPATALKLPSIFTDGMVLQQGMELPIFGWAKPGQKVEVQLGLSSPLAPPQPGVGGTATATSDEAGKWMVKLPAQKASASPMSLTVTSGGETVVARDILIGEVWFCSGQSNMQMNVAGSANGGQEVPAANHPTIRLYQAPNVQFPQPAADINAKWQVCSPQTVGGFSAAGYYFGREIQKQLNVPVGIINSSWGGSRIEPWTNDEGYKAVPDLKAQPQGGMYNGMIAALVPYAIRGALWYQGESNMGEGMLYAQRMKALVAGWRKVWGEGDFPFYFVQLAPFTYGGPADNLPKLWEAQTAAMNEIPNTGMIVITDITGNVRDIHPQNKTDVGKRLALWALAKTYGKSDVVYSGPMYKDMKIDGNKIVLSFDYGVGLKARDGKDLTHFQVAGEDKNFVAATAVIEGDKVIVSSPQVAAPAAVRFGWDKTANPNLVNQAGLPASPFRTDRW